MTAVAETFISIAWGVLSITSSLYLLSYFNSPLKDFPGPIPAGLTNLWRFLDVFHGRPDKTQLELHRKYGSAVRIGPNVISLSDPGLISKVYTTKGAWRKSDFYTVNDARVHGMRVPNVFSSTDEKWHSMVLRPIRQAYSMTQVLDMEPQIEVTIDLLCQKLDERFVKPGIACNMADYLLYAAWDAMGQATFSGTLGMLEKGYDPTKIIQTAKNTIDYFACFSQMPNVDNVLGKNKIVEAISPSGLGWAVKYIQDMYIERKKESQATARPVDFMDRVLQAQKKSPEIVDNGMATIYLLSNVLAGSDTTATAMCSAIYYILKHPSVHSKLREELDSANLPFPVKWKDLQHLTYFTAVMREAKRIHPGVGMLMERVVPAGGLCLPDGRFVPEGTIVGMNPWVINRDADTFGPDADHFIPERWLQLSGETGEEHQVRVARMQRAFLTFGAGSRSCIGRNFSEMESDKIVATLFAKYEMELAYPKDTWNVTSLWFVRQDNIVVNLKGRV
ncbi:cytochrome P450 [Aspergillus ruber CBS 135680]|uniref:Putative benzoate 4-monooxygenase cytochrome P450 n=1 Tax=Aspergillus ruber (strain CBS 135680) TaxID=1388766 RepID=A0A017SAP3_ASPRC|nr:putative benzoate 4-monooxygenase cytochrome P450 [Aspergillus ruber CBS 135680]EYE94002.1 putative benzoate 4-monooxygenase cytochrome P450 [Aspergillus ruber CBS 135680]